MLYLNWQLTLVFFAVTPAIAGVVLVVGRHFRRYSRRIQDSMGEVTQLSNESMHAFDEIRMFSASDQQSARFHAVSQFNRVQSLKLAFVQAVSTPIAQVLLAIALAVLFWLRLTRRFCWIHAGLAGGIHAAATQLGKPIRTLTMFRASFSEVLPPRRICLPRSTRLPRPTRGARNRPRAGPHRAGRHWLLLPGDERRVLEVSVSR